MKIRIIIVAIARSIFAHGHGVALWALACAIHRGGLITRRISISITIKEAGGGGMDMRVLVVAIPLIILSFRNKRVIA